MKPIYYFLLLNIFFLHSCKNQKKIDNAGEKIIVPAHVEVYNPFITDVTLHSLQERHKPFKIYTLINASCSTCLLKLEKWDHFSSKIPDSGKVDIILVCRSEDKFELLKFLFENHKVPNIQLPLVLDMEDSFLTRNKAFARFGDLTALTDSEDHVLLTGNPLESNEDRDKFFQAISKLNIER